MRELKPVKCGCGGEASVDYFIGEPSEGASYVVYCRKCEIQTMSYDTMTEAIQAWNRAMGATDNNVGNKERKKGEWIKEDLSGYLTPGGNCIYSCSECGHTEGLWPRPRLTTFCPSSCGADMRGRGE